ncbi:MAG: tRNA (adenosine(37)-N6)-dimethylallyltransferase MiaA [Oscillospiraceae bacterium]|jgi:tRNA dimethylallyltransferase
MKRIPLAVIVGPTGSGKTALSVELAKRLNAEIVSADSMQVYRQMRIATAKPTPEEIAGVPHHLLDFLDCSVPYNVAEYVQQASAIIQEISGRGALPMLVGGTGLYVSSLVNNISFQEIESNPELRLRLLERLKTEGGEALLRELAVFDPQSAAALHPNNGNRIVRAIEVYRLTGIPMSEHQRRSREKPSPYHLCMIGLSAKNRQVLYDRINTRVDSMMEQGLLEEARRVLALPNKATAYQAIGYKELESYFNRTCSLEEAVARIKQETRHYAKRQLTWFRRDERIHWLYFDELEPAQLKEAAFNLICREFQLDKKGESL